MLMKEPTRNVAVFNFGDDELLKIFQLQLLDFSLFIAYEKLQHFKKMVIHWGDVNMVRATKYYNHTPVNF